MPSSKSHLAAIGRVAKEWSRLEYNLQSSIALLAQVPFEISLILTNPANIKGWLEIVTRLAIKLGASADQMAKWQSISNKIGGQLLPARNKVIHGIWILTADELIDDPGAAPNKAIVRSVKKTGKVMEIENEMSATDIESIADQIRDSVDAISQFQLSLKLSLLCKQ